MIYNRYIDNVINTIVESYYGGYSLPVNTSLITNSDDYLRIDILSSDVKLIYLDKKVSTDYYTQNYDGSIKFDANSYLRNVAKLKSGRFTYKLLLYKSLISSTELVPFTIKQISPNRTEVMIESTDELSLNLFHSADSIYTLREGDNQLYYKLVQKLIINDIKDANEYRIANSAITYENFKHKLLLKLSAPLSKHVTVGMKIDIILLLGYQITEPVVIYAPKKSFEISELSPANYTLNLKTNNKDSGYKNYNSLISSDSTFVNDLINEYTYSSAVLNVDYSDFNNFVLYSNAAARVDNFKYKLEQLELYSSSLATIQSNITTPASSSTYFTNNVLQYNTKINEILTGFDQYEKYLYYNSSSYAWPKLTSVKPYLNCPTTNTTAINWYNALKISASLYDSNNQSALANSLPMHIAENDFNSNYITFVNLIGHQMDEIWLYIKQLTDLRNRDESISNGITKSLIFNVLQSYGWDGIDNDQFDDLWYSAFGTDKNYNTVLTGSLATQNWISVSSGSLTGKDISTEIWKRILNNLPYLNKSKGTKEGIRALINCYGIPSTELQIREFGGIDPTINTSEYAYNKFNYALTISSGSYINIPNIISGSQYPSSSIEFRFKPYNSNATLLYATSTNISSSFYINVDATGSLILNKNNTNYKLFNTNVVDNNWWHLTLNSTGTGSNIISSTLSSKVNDVCTLYTSSITAIGTAPLFNQDITSFKLGYTISCSLQDFREWSNTLDQQIIKTHCLAPTSYAGNNISSSYSDLLYRLPLGADLNKYNHTLTASLSSIHPNQNIINPTASLVNVGDNQYIGIEEVNYLYWPDTGNNRLISNNVRLAQSLTNDLQLNNISTVMTSSLNEYGASSNKIGIYFSPTAEVDQNIVESLGTFKIDDYIGDWKYEYSSSYNLESLQNVYYAQLSGSYNLTAYTRLIKYFNKQLFDQFKLLVPARSNLISGLTIEPSLLSRAKVFAHSKPIFDAANYDANLTVITGSFFEGSLIDSYDATISCSNGDSAPLSTTGIAFINGVEYLYTKLNDNFMPYYESAGSIDADSLPIATQNLLYNGCKISSNNYNEASLDTYDGKPVIELTISTRRIMTTRIPDSQGNFTVLSS